MSITRITSLVCMFALLAACERHSPSASPPPEASADTYGATSYTPYDSHAMMWSRASERNHIAWVASGGEAGRLLVSAAPSGRRPDWVLCTQGVVAGLAARGEKVCILATVYSSPDTIRPVLRVPRSWPSHPRSLYIPRSSIEFAFDRFLEREHLTRSMVQVPSIERPGFTTIKSLLAKPQTDADALDFAVLVDPFITILFEEQPGKYELGAGGLYDMYYSVVVRQEDVAANPQRLKDLLRQLLDAEVTFTNLSPDDFHDRVWGRMQDGVQERLPAMITFEPELLHLELRPERLRELLAEEIQYLVDKYPGELAMPADVSGLVNTTILNSVAPDRVIP